MTDVQSRLADFDDHKEMRQFWLEQSKRSIDRTITLVYKRLGRAINGTREMVKDNLANFSDYLGRFATIDVLAFAIYQLTHLRTWEIIEAIGGIDEDAFYYMLNDRYQGSVNGIPCKEFR